MLPLVSQMVSWSVVPLDTLMPGQAAYFLLGYGLGRWSLSGQQRVFLYLGGAAGYLVCTAVNLLSASPQEIPLPFSGGDTIFHYLSACALFVWVRTLWEKREEVLRPLARPLAWLSRRAFGIYWVHPLVLDLVVSGRPAGPDLWDLPGLLPGGIPHPSPEKAVALKHADLLR